MGVRFRTGRGSRSGRGGMRGDGTVSSNCGANTLVLAALLLPGCTLSVDGEDKTQSINQMLLVKVNGSKSMY